jgi:hypothetical protein
MITNQLLYHLTKRAYIGGEYRIRTYASVSQRQFSKLLP